VELLSLVTIRGDNARRGDQNRRIRHPERAKAGKCCGVIKIKNNQLPVSAGRPGVVRTKPRRMMLTSGTKSVSTGKLPHAREELGEPTDEDGHADDDIGSRNARGAEVDE
jgi:hypothetical protein